MRPQEERRGRQAQGMIECGAASTTRATDAVAVADYDYYKKYYYDYDY